MTDLITSPRARQGGTGHSGDVPTRPLAAAACVAALFAAGWMLLVCMALALVGWFASDAGAHGDTRDALRVGADAWLLAHGGRLEMPAATVSVVPLGLTLVCGYMVFRFGRWAGATSVVDDVRTAMTGVTVLAGVYAAAATVVAVLASVAQARPHPGLAFVGGFTLALLFGGAGIVTGSGLWRTHRGRLPEAARAVGTGAAVGVLLMLAAGSMAVLGALLVDFGAAANVLARLHTDVADGLLYSLVVASVVPNAVLLAGAYLTGPGFVVGTGTLVSPAAVTLGPVPAFPLLAALPDEGATPGWTVLLVGVPVAAGAMAGAAGLLRHPLPAYESGGLAGLGAGALAGLGFGALAFLAGGSAGPGRMADVGALAGQTVLAAVVAMGVGGLLGGLGATWWSRRRRARTDG